MVPVNATIDEFTDPLLPVLLQKINEGIADSWLGRLYFAVVPQNGWVQLCLVVAILVGAYCQDRENTRRHRARHDMC